MPVECNLHRRDSAMRRLPDCLDWRSPRSARPGWWPRCPGRRSAYSRRSRRCRWWRAAVGAWRSVDGVSGCCGRPRRPTAAAANSAGTARHCDGSWTSRTCCAEAFANYHSRHCHLVMPQSPSPYLVWPAPGRRKYRHNPRTTSTLQVVEIPTDHQTFEKHLLTYLLTYLILPYVCIARPD